MEDYYTASICLNGHVASTSVEIREEPDKHCRSCGEAVIQACAHCNAPIPGSERGGWSPDFDVPAHCPGCGASYPWTDRRRAGIEELAEAIEELTDFERDQLHELLPHLVTKTPRTDAAGFKVAAILSKMKAPARAILRDAIADVAVEAARRALGL